MPTIPVYIRKEDYAKFIEVYSPEWLHDCIQGVRNTHPKVEAVSQPKATGVHEELPCCKNQTPCKHWLWDGVKSTYTNTLSGRVVEVTQ